MLLHRESRAYLLPILCPWHSGRVRAVPVRGRRPEEQPTRGGLAGPLPWLLKCLSGNPAVESWPAGPPTHQPHCVLGEELFLQGKSSCLSGSAAVTRILPNLPPLETEAQPLPALLVGGPGHGISFSPWKDFWLGNQEVLGPGSESCLSASDFPWSLAWFCICHPLTHLSPECLSWPCSQKGFSRQHSSSRGQVAGPLGFLGVPGEGEVPLCSPVLLVMTWQLLG